jgi:hypothetical protein
MTIRLISVLSGGIKSTCYYLIYGESVAIAKTLPPGQSRSPPNDIKPLYTYKVSVAWQNNASFSRLAQAANQHRAETILLSPRAHGMNRGFRGCRG